MRQQVEGSGTDTLEYIRSMLGQLRTMAEAESCDMLAYLIEMAYIEASDILSGERPLDRDEFRSIRPEFMNAIDS